ncbi:MAG: hypothetical protein H6577_23700 [Lewinellaceae bacterium]|nr:hypothetical protein [Saprospiraceae bacterium]MCB9341143.1 hypothetical protein [Lewinellaceae bacterium]
MSKKDFDFEKLSSLKPKKAESQPDTEEAVKSIHEKVSGKEKVKRVTIDLPFSVYVDIRKKTIEKEITLKEYFLKLHQFSVLKN